MSPNQKSEERSVNTEPALVKAMAQELNWRRKKTQLQELLTEIETIKDKIVTTEKQNEGLQTEIDQRQSDQPKRRIKLADPIP